MNYVKFLNCSIDASSRDKREISVALDLGYDVTILTTDHVDKNDEILKKCKIIVFKANFSASPSRFSPLNLLYRTYLFFKRLLLLYCIKSDVISCHDLSALRIGYIISLFKIKKPKLVYDAHEFEIGRRGSRSAKKLKQVCWWEKFLIKKSAFSIMVNDIIKEETIKAYGLDDKYPIIVVRSIPPLWTVSSNVLEKKRTEITEKLNVSMDAFIVMYHGVIMSERGVEQLLLSIQMNKNIVGLIMGFGSEAYINELKSLVAEYNIQDRVLFLPPVAQKDIWQYAGAVDVGMVIAQPTCTNHLYMLPNKFFENIQSETPIICSNFPVVSKIVNDYDIGLTCDPTSPEDMNRVIEELRTNKDLYKQKKENVKKAKEVLCWENEKNVLKEAFEKYL